MIPSPAELKGEKVPEKVRGSARAAGPPDDDFVMSGQARRSLRSVGIYAQ